MAVALKKPHKDSKLNTDQLHGSQMIKNPIEFPTWVQ